MLWHSPSPPPLEHPRILNTMSANYRSNPTPEEETEVQRGAAIHWRSVGRFAQEDMIAEVDLETWK